MLSAVTPSPGPSPTPTFTDPLTQAAARCEQGALICTSFQDWFGDVRAGLWAQTLLGTPLQLAVIVVLGLVLRYVLHRLIGRLTEQFVAGAAGLGRLEATSSRREQRVRTTASVLRSLTTGVVMTVVLLMVLQALGIPIGPLLASAGIFGVAVGFGSQALVKDFLSGIFMIVEDQYGVGDVVDLGEASGVVEAVGLRVTRLRDVDGAVWYVRNGEVLRVGNRSQGWARAVLDVGIGYDEDVDRACEVVLDVAQGLQRDPQFSAHILEDPQVTGIESVSAEGIVVRLMVKTAPMEQWGVARELRRRIKLRFDAEGIRAAHGPGAVVVRAATEPGT